jgi:drug/metabolite transporter (DMT)-like permease
VALGVAAALAAALCWTLASLLWRRLPTSLGAGQLNLLKNLLALAMLAPVLLLGGRGGVEPVGGTAHPTVLLSLSGVLGIALGDSLFFAALRRLGTRRTLTFEAGGPGLTGAAAGLVLGEAPAPGQWLGIALISLALLLVARQSEEPPPGSLAAQQGAGLLLALGALLGGSGGALLARAALQEGLVTPMAAAAIRLAAASLVMLPLLPGLLQRLRRPKLGPWPSRRRWPLVLVATLLGTTAGIALQQLALSRLPAGLAVALLATAPVMAVLLAPLEGDRPRVGGWLAAISALAGVVLVVR